MKTKLLLIILILSLLTLPIFAVELSSEPEPSANDGLYPEITSQDEWFLNREIASYRILGVKSSIHLARTDSVFRKYVGKTFNYALLTDLQKELYNTGFFESFDPQVDIDADKKLILIFDFKEIPVIKSISFISDVLGKKLSFSDSSLRKESGINVGDTKTKREIEKSSLLIKDYYAEQGRPDTEVSVGLYTDPTSREYNIVYTIKEGAEKKIAEIDFIGNKSISTQVLIKNMKSKVSTSNRKGFYSQKLTSEDISSLEQYYKKNGYKDIKISGPEIEVIEKSEDKNVENVKIIFTIEEGKKWTFGYSQFEGNDVFDTSYLESKLSYKKGNVFDFTKCENDANEILSDYYNNGYIYADVAVDTIANELSGEIGIKYTINEGKQSYIERVNISGLTKTHKFVFLRELAFQEGDIFSREKIQKSFQNIYNTGLVKDLNYELNPGSDKNNLVLDLNIEEAQSMDVTFGTTFGGTEGSFPLSLVASFNNKNFRGEGINLSVGTQVKSDYQSLSISFGSPWFGRTRWNNSFNFSFERNLKSNALQRNPNSEFQVGRNNAYPLGYSSYEDFMAYDEAITSTRYLMKYDMLRFSLGYNTGYTWIFKPGRLSVSGGLSLGLNHAIYSKDEYIPFEYLVEQYRRGWKFSNRLYVGASWDGRDFIDDTTKGYTVSQNFVYAGGLLGGLSNYIKSTTTLSGYLMLLKTKDDGIRPTALVGSYTTTLSMMLPQFYSTDLDGGDTSWRWHDPKYGATRSEMIYIDGMRYARGHRAVYDISFMWDNILELAYPLVRGIINGEVFSSLTLVSKNLDNMNMIYYGAFGAGLKLKISGFPLGIYLVGDYKIKDDKVTWVDGGLFNYVHPVVAVSTSLI